MRMTTAIPARKVMGGSLGAAVSALAIWGFQVFFDIEIPIYIHGAITVIVTFAVGYLVPPSERDQIITVPSKIIGMETRS